MVPGTFSTFSSLDIPRVINLPSARGRVRIGFHLSGYQPGGGSVGPLRKTPTPRLAGEFMSNEPVRDLWGGILAMMVGTPRRSVRDY